MIKDKKIEDRIRQSLATNFETFADKTASLEQFAKEMTLENLEYNKDDYLKYCLYETMRMEAPVPVSSTFMMTENLDIGPYKIRAGDMMFTNIQKLHHLEDQWGPDHNEFKPERFADRGKHHPMCFIPFLAGKRVCIGKTFAESTMKVVMPLIMKAFSGFEFVNKELYHVKHINNTLMKTRPEVMIIMHRD